MLGFYHWGALQMLLYRCHPEKQLLFQLWMRYAYNYLKHSVFLLYFGAHVSLKETLQLEWYGY